MSYSHKGTCVKVNTLTFPYTMVSDTRKMNLQTAGDPNKWVDEHGWSWLQSNGQNCSGQSEWRLDLNSIQSL